VSPERLPRLALWILAIFTGIALFADGLASELHGTAVFYAALAREMIDLGDPLAVFTGERAYLLKPPLVPWLSAGAMWLFGLNDFAATLPVRIAGVACVWVTYLVGARVWGRAAALMLVTLGPFIQFTTTIRMEPALTLGMWFALLGYLAAEQRWASAAFFGGIAVAVLAKGPNILVLLAVLPLHALIDRGPLRYVLRWQLRWALLLLLPLGWYAWLWGLHGNRVVTEIYGDFLRGNTAGDISQFDSAVREYVIKPLNQFWPWLPLFVLGVFTAVHRAWKAAAEERAVLVLLLVLIAVTVIGSIYKPDHDLRYWYYVFPAMALLAGRMVAAWTGSNIPRAVIAAAGILLAIASAYSIVFVLRHRGEAVDLARIQALHDSGELHASNTLFIGGPPYSSTAVRRQHTQRDWCYFHLGFEPEVMWWSTARTADLSSYDYIVVPDSKNSRKSMQETGLQPIATTRKMILTRPQRATGPG
jgi:4-amino-4-deoxy-L-arabinose transferase-like glycosyltransferase